MSGIYQNAGSGQELKLIANVTNVIDGIVENEMKAVTSNAVYDALETKQDTLTQGTNITISGNTISATDTTYSDATTSKSGLMSATDKTKLNGIASGAQVNQNAFSNVKVGSTTIAADTKTDTLELVAGSNVTLTPDATNDKVTISATDTTYSTVSKTADGLCPQLPNETTTTKYLRQDGSWAIPAGTSSGTVTSVATGAGLTGGTITTSGTIKCDLKSETKSSLTAAAMGTTSSRQYAVGLDTNGNLSVNIPWTNTTKGNGITTNAAQSGSGTTVTTSIAASTTMDNAIGTLLKNDYALNSNKQPKTLATALTLGGTQYTTVEGVLSAIVTLLNNTAYWNKGA